MKKINLFTIILLAALISLNIFSFVNVNSRFISFLNNSLTQQANLCGSYMENELNQFEIDLNKLLFDYNFSEIFNDQEALSKSNQSLQVFYMKYKDLVTNVFVYDANRNYYGLYLNDKDEFVLDTFSRQRQQDLFPRHKVEKRGNKLLYHYPYFEADKVSGNIIVEIDFSKFAREIFALYPKGETISWKWVLSSKGEILINDFNTDFQIGSIGQIADSIDMFSPGIIKHSFSDTTGSSEKVYSAYYPMSIFSQSLGIVFSASKRDFNRYFILQNLIVSISAFIISLALILYLLFRAIKGAKREKNYLMAETVFRQVIENLPVGIIIMDAQNIIRNINSRGQELLFIDKKQDLSGVEFSDQLLLSNKYLLQDDAGINNSRNYLYYEKDGIETVIYKQENNVRIGGENLRLVGLIDVSALERARKQELAANRTKSDFIALMSQEIHNPMNVIIKLVTDLLKSKLPDKEKEDIRQIKKSSDLLMTIIKDIRDLSKIEAGKMVLKEIPFNLREEISIVLKKFAPIADEKGITLETDVKSDVPDKLIGDPFRIRQVISNLLSNAFQYTSKGRVVIGTNLVEIEKNSLQLLFFVEDTGIGIPKDKLKDIFTNYSQLDEASGEKFGGSAFGTVISKQLVELMNGEIWVESPSGISNSADYPGSKFSFTIIVSSNEPLEKNFDFSGIKKLQQISVLLLTKESKPGKVNILKLLNAFGVNIVTKIYQDSTIESLMHHIKSHDIYNLIVISESNVDGFSLAKNLKSEDLIMKYPVILVSNSDQVSDFRVARKLMIDYYLVEPVESKEIFDILVQIFTGLTDKNSITPILNSLPPHLNILLAEDNPINQKVAQTIFKHIGYEIDLVSNGKEVLEIIKGNTYDIIFMDIMMPEMDGIEATISLREKGIDSPVIAMSVDDSEERKSQALHAGMEEFLNKPIKIDSVKQLLIKKFSN